VRFDANEVPILNLADMAWGSVFGKSTLPLIVLMQRTAQATITSVENCFRLRMSSSMSLKTNKKKASSFKIKYI